MPVLLEGEVRFPTEYSPWYVYVAPLDSDVDAFELLDILVPDSDGLYDRLETDDAVLITGYVFALQKFSTDLITSGVQCAIPGSAVPFIADTGILPNSLVAVHYTGGVQTVAACSAAQFAAGKSLGRIRCHHDDAQTLRKTGANDVVILQTGCC